MATLKTAMTDWLRVKVQGSTPATPATGYGIFYDKNGTPAYKNAAGVETIMGAATFLNDYIKVSDVKSANTAGGTFTSGAFQTRTINTEDSDAGGHCTIGSNQITLVAGTYVCCISAPANTVYRHQAILYNVTDAANALIGTSEYAHAEAFGQSRSFITGKFVIAGSKAFEVRHRCQQTKTTSGFGLESNFGVSEVYTVAEFWKVA